jgi:hypothetical protein
MVSTGLCMRASAKEQRAGARFPPLLKLRASNFSGKAADEWQIDAPHLMAAMALIPAAYGCVHVGALSLQFPTVMERLLWKISCYYLIATALAASLLYLSVYLPDRGERWGRIIASPWHSSKAILEVFGDGEYIRNWIFYWAVVLIGLVYILSRAYLVIESFISLRHVPMGVYATPRINFMDYIPHF